MMYDFDLSGVPRRVGGDDKEEVRKVQRFAELKLAWRMWGVPTSERLVVMKSRDVISILDADDSGYGQGCAKEKMTVFPPARPRNPHVVAKHFFSQPRFMHTIETLKPHLYYTPCTTSLGSPLPL